ncbi:MAG: beta-lactamase family protein [Kouleothrix sp.]|nr:beta-lactamase family protein [Kouleothrix sp.]
MTIGGISPALRDAVEQAMRGGQVPGLVVAIARGRRPLEHLALGADAVGRPIERDSLFPVASITKMATALAVLRLADAGQLDLDDPLDRHLPQAVAAQPGVTLRRLLCHTSGLPLDVSASAARYTHGLDWPTLATACLLTALQAPPDTRVQYSNVGYGLLALVVEHRTGQEFADALDQLVSRPLGVEAYLGVEPPRQPVILANVRSAHSGGDLEPFNSAFWRGLAFPWAGLMTTAEGAIRIAQAFQGFPDGFLSAKIRSEATRSHTGDLPGGFAEPLIWSRCAWGLGPELRGDKTPHWVPPQAGADSYGHSGASGALAWVSPAADVAWAILGARTADNGWLLRRSPAISAAILEG